MAPGERYIAVRRCQEIKMGFGIVNQSFVEMANINQKGLPLFFLARHEGIDKAEQRGAWIDKIFRLSKCC